MKLRVRVWIAMAAMVALLGIEGRAQPAPAEAPKAPEAAPKVSAPGPRPAGSPKRLAKGVMEPIELSRPLEETVQRHDVTELVAVDANFDWAKDAPFRQRVWMLEFKFKPIRMIWLEVPGKNGQMQRKLVWYLIYSVTNPGKVFLPTEEPDKTFKVEQVDKPVRFIPVFTLEVHNRLQDEAAGFTKAYAEKLIPVALGPIRLREDANRKFFTSVEMPTREIAVGETLWGVATWEGIDPRNVWFSVYVEGLTNAYRFQDDPSKYAAREPFRSLYRKVLKLNFWRPGDEYTTKETQVHYGLLNFDLPGVREYEWVWRRAL